MEGFSLANEREALDRSFDPAARRSSRRSRVRSKSWQLKAASILLCVHLGAAPLLFGGVFPSTMIAIAASALVCLAASIYASGSRRATTPAMMWMAAALLGWTAIQAANLPCAWVEWIKPAAVAEARAARAALGSTTALTCSLSFDVGVTREEVIKGIAIVATLMAAGILVSRGARRTVLWGVAFSTLAMSAVALLHPVLGLQQVFGVYQPVQARQPWLLAPLMNANNLGGFAAMGAPLWIGLTYRDERQDIRWLGRAAVVLTALTAILTLSRGAIAQLLGATFFMVAFVYVTTQRKRKNTPAVQLSFWKTRRIGLVATLATALALAGYIASGPLALEFQHGDLSKLKLVQRAFAFAFDHPWIGVGRGAFSSAFVALEGRTIRYEYAENFIAQWFSEWGIPISLAWLVVLAVAVFRRLQNLKSLAVTGGLIGLLSLTAQNLVDLGFEILGVAIVAAALLAATLLPDGATQAPQAGKAPQQARRSSERASRTPLWRSQIASACVMLLAGLAGLAVLGPDLTRGSVANLETELRGTMETGERSAFRRTLQHAVSLHPSEPVFPILAATEAMAYRDRSAGRWLNRAMQVAPHWAAPHVLAFQWLWRRGAREQALLELKLAAAVDPRPEVVGEHYCRIAEFSGEYVIAAAPSGAARRSIIEMAARCLQPDHESAPAIDMALLREFPNSTQARERIAVRKAADGDVDGALAVFSDLLERDPNAESVRIRRADVLRRAERLPELIRLAERDLEHVHGDHKIQLLSIQALAYAQLGDAAGADRTVAAYRRLVSHTAAGLAASFGLEGQLQVLLRNDASALTAFREAYRINKETDYLRAIAHIARRMGDRSQVLWAYMQLCEREPATATHCAERDRLLSAEPNDVR